MNARPAGGEPEEEESLKVPLLELSELFLEESREVIASATFLNRCLAFHEHVEFLDNSQFDPSRLDIFRSLSRTYLWTAVVLVVFAKKAFGWSALLEPRNLRRVAYLIFKGSYIYLGSLQHRFRNRRKVRSEDLAAATADFEGYGGEAPLLPWATEEAE